jgi:hypothetical protein
MPANDQGLAPIVLIKMRPLSDEVDYTMALSGPFDVQGPLSTFQQEAGAKGLAVVVTVGFVTLDEFWGEEPEEIDGND